MDRKSDWYKEHYEHVKEDASRMVMHHGCPEMTLSQAWALVNEVCTSFETRCGVIHEIAKEKKDEETDKSDEKGESKEDSPKINPIKRY